MVTVLQPQSGVGLQTVVGEPLDRDAPWSFCQCRSGLALLALIVLVGLAIRVYRSPNELVWFDEAFSWRLIQFPFWEMLVRTARDNHPPLYFALLKAWAGVFGTSAIALRSLSVALGALTIVGMYAFAAEAFEATRSDNSGVQKVFERARLIALLTAALVALSVFQVRWSWEVRMYTLGTALAAFSSWGLFRALRETERPWRWWALYGVMTLLFAYTHYYAMFSIAAQAIFLLGYLLVQVRGNVRELVRSGLLRRAILGASIVLLGWSPWLPLFLRQRAQVQADFWISPFTAWDLPHACYQTFFDPQDAVLSPMQSLAVAACCAVGLVGLLWKAGAGEWYVFTAVVIPVASAVFVSVMDTPIFQLRYLLFVHLFLMSGLAVLIARIPAQLERGLVTVLVLGNFVWVDVAFWQKLGIADESGAKAAAAYVEKERREGEPVVVAPPLIYLSLLYHACDRAAWRLYNDGREVVHYEGNAVLTAQDLITPQQLEDLRGRRVWVVNTTGGWVQRTVPVAGRWRLISETRFQEVHRFRGEIVVLEYERNGS